MAVSEQNQGRHLLLVMALGLPELRKHHLLAEHVRDVSLVIVRLPSVIGDVPRRKGTLNADENVIGRAQPARTSLIFLPACLSNGSGAS